MHEQQRNGQERMCRSRKNRPTRSDLFYTDDFKMANDLVRRTVPVGKTIAVRNVHAIANTLHMQPMKWIRRNGRAK